MRSDWDAMTAEEQRKLDNAVTFEGLCGVAQEVLSRMTGPVGMVCGPITSGGGRVEENLASLRKAIMNMRTEGKYIFDQTLFEPHLKRIRATPHCRSENHLLEAFYLPLFESGRMMTLYFVPGWERSDGARWEHQQAERLGIEIVYL